MLNSKPLSVPSDLTDEIRAMSTGLLEELVDLSKAGGYHSSELPSATDLLGVEKSSIPSREETSVPLPTLQSILAISSLRNET